MKCRLFVFLFLTGLCSLGRCLPHQYHFIGITLPWLKAQTYCREHYTDLATVFDIEDMNRLVNTAQVSSDGFTGMAWIGLHDNLTSWRWSFSNSRYYGNKQGDYRNWDFSQPDNNGGDQMCVEMWSGGVWKDSQCFLRNPFICYNGLRTIDANQHFILVEKEMSWSDAQLYCRKRYTDLASVRDEKENQEIQLLARKRTVWIGLHRTREWSDQSVSTYHYWKKGQPDNFAGRQNCTASDLGNAGLWSDEHCSEELVFICYGEKDETVSSTATTVTTNKITTTEGDSTSTKLTSSVWPSSPEVEQTTFIPDQTPHQSSHSTTITTTTTTVTPNKRTTTEYESTTGHLSTEITSFGQPSTKEVDQTTINTSETPNKPLSSTTTTRTTVTPNKRTTTDTESTTGHFSTEMTSFEQPSTTEVDQTQPISNQTPQKSSHSTTTTTTTRSTVIPNERTTTEIESTTGHLSTEITLFGQPSTKEVDQTTINTSETPNKPLLSTTTTRTTVTPKKRTTTDTESTTSHFSTDITSAVQHSIREVDPTRPIFSETPNKPLLSTTTTRTSMTPNKRTTTDTESTTGHCSTENTSFGQPSTKEVDQTTINTSETPLSTTKMITIEGDSTSTGVTQQYLTPTADQKTIAEHVIHLKVKFTSKIPLSEDEIQELVLVEFRNQLIEMGLPTSIKVGLKRPLKSRETN